MGSLHFVFDFRYATDYFNIRLHCVNFTLASLGSQSDSSRYDDVNYILKTIDESDYLTK